MNTADLDRSTPVLVLKLDVNPFHHGALAIIRSLGRSGVPVYAVLDGPGSPAGLSRYLTGRFSWTPDLDDVPALLAGLREMAAAIPGRAVLIPTDDAGAILIAEHADVLEPVFLLPRQPAGLPRQLASKEQLAALCREVGVPTPEVRAVPALGGLTGDTGGLTFPLVVKIAEPWQPGERHGLKSTTIVDDAEQLAALAARFPDGKGPAVLLQEYLPADSCEDWFFHGHVGEEPDGSAVFRMSVTGQKIRSFPPTAGITTLGRAWDNPELRAVAEKFLAGVGYRGIVDLDFRLDRRTGVYHLLDANPRPGAQFAVARRSDGIDAAQALHRELTGRPVPPQAEQSRDHALCVENYDAASVVWSLAHRRLTVRGWRRTLTAGPVELAWYSRDDVRPALRMWARFALRPLTRLLTRAPGRAYAHPVPHGAGQAADPSPAPRVA
jgi:predicted ATP-grasp superfamily ATP-dependent carboligase